MVLYSPSAAVRVSSTLTSTSSTKVSSGVSLQRQKWLSIWICASLQPFFKNHFLYSSQTPYEADTIAMNTTTIHLSTSHFPMRHVNAAKHDRQAQSYLKWWSSLICFMIWSFLASNISLSKIRGWRRPYFSSILVQILDTISAIPLLPSLVLGNAVDIALLAVGKWIP